MDEIKLNKWKERFEQEVKNVQIEYNSFFLDQKLQDAYTIELGESNEWWLIINEQVPKEIKTRLQEAFLATKPEDSV